MEGGAWGKGRGWCGGGKGRSELLASCQTQQGEQTGLHDTGRGGGTWRKEHSACLASSKWQFCDLGPAAKCCCDMGTPGTGTLSAPGPGPRRVLATGTHLLTPRPALSAGPSPGQPCGKARAQLSQCLPRASVSPARRQASFDLSPDTPGPEVSSGVRLLQVSWPRGHPGRSPEGPRPSQNMLSRGCGLNTLNTLPSLPPWPLAQQLSKWHLSPSLPPAIPAQRAQAWCACWQLKLSTLLSGFPVPASQEGQE